MPTRFKGPADQVQALDTLIKLVRAVDAVQAALEPSLTGAGLTPTQFGVMEALHHLGPMRPGVLCQKLLKSGANLTTVLDNLEKKGLVRREASAEDGRSLLVHLTPEGRKSIQRVFPVHAAAVARLFSALRPAEQKQLGRLTKKLGLAVRPVPPTEE